MFGIICSDIFTEVLQKVTNISHIWACGNDAEMNDILNG